MKKQLRRLSIRKETLGTLVAGAVRPPSQTSCFCFNATGCECNSQDPACTLPATACLASCSC